MMKAIFIIIVSLLSFRVFAAKGAELPVIAHWSFDHDSGMILQDSGPNKLNAELLTEDAAKVETVKGMSGKALKLSANPLVKYRIQDKEKKLNLKPPFTIAMWIKRTGKMPKSMCLLGKMWDGGKVGWDLRYDWTMLSFRFGDGEKRQMVFSPKHQIKNEKWYHVAVSDDGKKVQLFINCTKVKEQLFENAAPAADNNFAVIGNFIGRENVYNFIGLLDEVYIIGRVLSSEELFELSAPARSD